MSFPTTPTNGQQSVVNGITYQYASATNSWTRVPGIAGNISASGNVTAANFITNGVVTATGNITGNYFLGNGSQLTGINTSLSGNLAGNLQGNGYGANAFSFVSAVGNITGNYFIGNGSQLTGISAGSGNAITNGTSNVAIPVANGNIQVAVNSVANSVVMGTGSLFVQGPISTPKTINTLALVPNEVNAVMISPLTISASGNIFVPTDSTLTIFTPT
jgi:hypothetical protein